jgi:hypothetical protein
MSTEPARDPELAALLRRAAGDPPPADLERLRSAVTARAELPLARLRRPARVGRRAWLPLGIAASVAAALTLALRPDPRPLPAEEQRVVEAIVDASIPENVDLMISGDAARGALLAAAVGS